MSTSAAAYSDRQWSPQPRSESVFETFLDAALRSNERMKMFADAMLGETAIRLRDIVDHVVTSSRMNDFSEAGWSGDERALSNTEGMFPDILAGERDIVVIRVESVADFVSRHGADGMIEGASGGPMRRVAVFDKGESVALHVIERNGYAGFDLPPDDPAERRAARIHAQAFRSRRRQFDTVVQGLDHTDRLVEAAVGDLGPHRACHIWLEAERDYWMRRCRAGRIQKSRQDGFGVGWCNIDHHTYDGSREHFRRTIGILERLGYELREMLYAGELAGWGSQVLEQPVIGSTIFADVDLSPEELTVDFAHEGLDPLPKHRRAGLLSELLGESILEAGLNHVAGLYDNERFREIAASDGTRTMPPFSDMDDLYQELTEGDWDAVDPSRVDALEAAGHIGADEAEKLRLQGSIVTHLEDRKSVV